MAFSDESMVIFFYLWGFTSKIFNCFITLDFINASADCNISVPIQRKSYLYSHGCSSLNRNAAVRILCRVKLEDDVDDETCELVNGAELVLGEGQDSIRAYLLKAVKNNNRTGILLLSDIFGYEDSSTRDFAYRVACNGYKYVFLRLTLYMCDVSLLLVLLYSNLFVEFLS